MLAHTDNGPWPPCPAPFNMAAHVLAPAAVQGDKIALVVMGRAGAERWSYARLEAAVRGTASGLLGAGIDPGQRLLLRLGNTVDFPIVYLGAIAAGIIPVPTSPMLTEAEVSALLPDLAPEAVALAPGIACPASDGPRRLSLETLRAFHDLAPVPYRMGDPDRAAYIVYTSGTSGRPRGVIHAHRAIWARGMMTRGWYAMTPEDRLAHAGAFNWTFTLGTGLMDPWANGATALIAEPDMPVEAWPHLLRRHDASIFAAAPGVYRKLLQTGARFDLPLLRHGLSAGEKLSPAIADGWTRATGTLLHEAYGMSECSTFISAAPDRPADVLTLGRAQPGRRIAIRSGDAMAELGQEGDICVHASDPGLMLGYLNAPSETRARYRDDWFVTGDLGAMDAAGQITYLGRADDMMNAGGYRVSPIEVETAMAECPGVRACAAVSVPVSARGGEAHVIALFYTSDTEIDAAVMRDHAQARLARYKQPRIFTRLAELPTGANGKLLRKKLREGYDRTHG